MMLSIKQLSKLSLFAGGTTFGMTGIMTLKSGDVKCVYTHVIAAALCDKDCVMKAAPMFRKNYDNIYEDAKDLNERRYAMDMERAYQKAKALAEEHEIATEA